MRPKKAVSLIVGMCGIICGILIIVFSVMDKPFPKLLWLLFSVFCMVNGILNGAKKK